MHSSCDIKPSKGLDSCLSPKCGNPQLHVETQVFLVVNASKALNFADFAQAENIKNGLYQTKTLLTGSGKPIVFASSTNRPKYTQAQCFPVQVTQIARPQYAKSYVKFPYKWAKDGNIF